MTRDRRTVTLDWEEGLRFQARTEEGAVTTIDGAGSGGSPSPMYLLLESLGACMAIDVVDILEKSREQVRGLEVEVSGVRREEPPRKYVELSLDFLVRGEDLSRSKVERAVDLSLETYCSVFHTLDPRLRESAVIQIRTEDTGGSA